MTNASRVALQALLVPWLFPNHHQFLRTFTISSPTSTKKSSRISCLISASAAAAAATASIPWGCEVDSLENAETLQKWLSASGLPPQKMKIERVEVGERGLVALKNIRKGEKLLFVPPSLVITADSDLNPTPPLEGGANPKNSSPLVVVTLGCGFGLQSSSFPIISKPRIFVETFHLNLTSQDIQLMTKGVLLVSSPTASLCVFRTRSELDRYLEASQIRERAIGRSNDVVGTYNDLKLRIFSKYPDLFPEEVLETALREYMGKAARSKHISKHPTQAGS
ncbi:hypothetical protein Cgig2_009052 [Carnegiea gigantea]|uniref:Uncharacterized protein n=1 Tax=Carnegiea gigantea TaxID=171969 RepID=A0A9Q1QL66_9CARY|nr:hypothetical protein Cgig2_009052 [Carnegiea gigantea]